MGNIQKKFLPHPLLPALGMAGRTETTGFEGKREEALFPTVWTPDAGNPAHRIAAVEMLLNNILNNGTEIAILSLKPALVFSEKLLEVMKKHPVEDGALRMSRKIDPCHSTRTLVH